MFSGDMEHIKEMLTKRGSGSLSAKIVLAEILSKKIHAFSMINKLVFMAIFN